MEAGTADNCAEDHKCCKYAALAEAYQFEPIALETKGVYFESTGVILMTTNSAKVLISQSCDYNFRRI